MLPQRSHFKGGKSLLSSSASPCHSMLEQQQLVGICNYYSNSTTLQYLAFFPSVFCHIRMRKFYMSDPIGRSIKGLTAHVASKRRVFFFLNIPIFIRAVNDFLQFPTMPDLSRKTSISVKMTTYRFDIDFVIYCERV